MSKLLPKELTLDWLFSSPAAKPHIVPKQPRFRQQDIVAAIPQGSWETNERELVDDIGRGRFPQLESI